MKRFVGKLLISVGILAMIGGTGFALPPPRPGLVDPLTQRYRTSGQKVPVFPEKVRTYRPSPRGGRIPLDPKRAPARAGVRPLAVDTATQFSITPLVLLIDFADRPASASPAISNPAIDSLFFGSGPADLSVLNYWKEVSYGKFSIRPPSSVPPGNPNVVGWLRAGGTGPGEFPTSITSYKQVADVQVTNVQQLLADAVAYLVSQGFDFSPYVRPSDGTFNAVILVQPGAGQEDSGMPGDTYSHTSQIVPISTPYGDIVDYTIVPAKQYYSDPSKGQVVNGIEVPDPDLSDDPLVGAGVIVHEMGHLLGLPDLYPTQSFGQVSDNVFSGAGVFDLMAYGLWGSNLLARADVPAHLSAWSKSDLGWLLPNLVTATSSRTLPPVELSASADKVFSNSVADPTQYFLVENRQVSSTLGDWLFDKFLPGAGLLVWQIDEYVIETYRAINRVNNNPQFRGVYVKEADGTYHLGQPIPPFGNPNDLAKYFGQQGDYFLSAGQLFDRTSPSSSTTNPFDNVNSSPIVDTSYTNHPFDFKEQVLLFGFSRTGNNSVDYLANITPAAGGGPSWKTFNVGSTAGKYPNPMRSNDILSVAFDSGNNTWMGSSDQGIFRFLGTNFNVLTTSQGLPSPAAGAPAGTTVGRVQAMAFEGATGSMWVGTDQGLFKMRDAGSGFRVVSSFTEGSPSPDKMPPGANGIAAVAIRGGFTSGSAQISLKYAATPIGLIRIDDQNTDAPADDNPGFSVPNPLLILNLAGFVPATALAIDDNGTPEAAIDDIIWVGFANGDLYRSKAQTESNPPPESDPLINSHFVKVDRLSGGPRITSLAVDKQSVLWIGMEGRGVEAFLLGVPRRSTDPAVPDEYDPYDFNGDGNTISPAVLNFNATADDNGVYGSNNVTGIAFQATDQARPVAWISQKSDNFRDGGASRFNANLTNDNTTANRDERLKVYSPIPPDDVATAFGRSSSASAVAGDAAGNVWFGTTQPEANGVVRFGNAGILSLDSSNYVNTTAVARVTLQDDGLNSSSGAVDTAVVRITSTSDPVGFFLVLVETGEDTGVFSASFGFTNGTTDPVARLISVQTGNEVTATYVDSNPPGIRRATATWKTVYPFEDGIFIKPLCFISTAAYGSAMAPEVVTFRAFRDRYLAGSMAGRALVEFYYLASPPLARCIARSGFLRAAARLALAPAAGVSAFAVAGSPAERGAVALLLLLATVWVLARRGKNG